jgi:hypothetical protein
VPRMHLAFDAAQRDLQQVLLPFLVPHRRQVEPSRVGGSTVAVRDVASLDT